MRVLAEINGMASIGSRSRYTGVGTGPSAPAGIIFQKTAPVDISQERTGGVVESADDALVLAYT